MKRNNKIARTLSGIIKDKNIAQKDLTDIFQVKNQGGVSKRFITGNVTIDELFAMSVKYNFDFFMELSTYLPSDIRNTYTIKEYVSPVEVAILNLVKKK